MKNIVYKMLVYIEQSYIVRCIPDRIFIWLSYFLRTRKILHWNNPTLYNEKIQWLKIYDRNPAYSKLVDKQAAKEWVSEKLGAEYVFPTLGIWDKFADINFDKLPEQFVLKCTHDSGGVLVCKDKAMLNYEKEKKFFEWHMKRNYYWHGRQWHYNGVKPRIIAEKYMVDESQKELKDYKVFCFNGEPKVIQVDFGRYEKHERNLYTPEWEYIPAQIKYPTNPSHQIEKPVILEELLRCARILSDGMRHVRVDFYIIGNKLYFGEMTFYHGDGCEKFTPQEFEKIMGGWIDVK